MYISTSRMRNIHAQIISEYGKESVKILRQWEKLEMKMADFENHRRFLLRCLSNGITPFSIKLKSNVKTPKGIYIVRKAEKMLMNERLRSINNTVTILNCQIDTCMNDLKSRINKEDMEDCYIFMNQKRERRHCKTLERQIDKFN